MESVNCARCGRANLTSSETCIRCGAELAGPFVNRSMGEPSFESSHAGRENWSATVEQEPALSPHVGPFTSVRAVVSPTIDLFKDNFWLIIKIVVVVFAPYEIFKALEGGSGRPGWQLGLGLFLLDLTCRALVAPALLFALMTVMRTRQSPSVTEAYRWSVGRLGRFMVCAALAWVVQMLGFVALIIPGIILGLAFIVVYPMAALENRGPVKILERSYRLTKGYRGRIFLASLCIGLLSWVIALPAGILMGILMAGGVNFWPLTVLITLITDVGYQLSTVLSLVIYLSLVTHAPREFVSREGAQFASAL